MAVVVLLIVRRWEQPPLASIGRPLPSYVLRQNAIEGLVGEEAAAAFTGQKPIPQALADAERRVDDLLAQAE